MKKRILSLALALVMCLSIVPATALAAEPPKTISAPLYLGVADYLGANATCTISAPDDLRALLDQTQEERGYAMFVWAQVDFKIDGGGWHHTSAWDDPATFQKYALAYYNDIQGGKWKQYLGTSQLNFKNLFPEETNAPPMDTRNSWEWYKAHSITYRARFSVDCNSKGKKTIVFSSWSQEFTRSASLIMDYKKILNENTPKLTSSQLTEEGINKVPTIWIDLGPHPADIQRLNAAANNSMWTEVWMRREGDREFKKVGEERIKKERFNLDVAAYYKDSNIKDFAAAAYEVKVRYKLDERDYRQSEVTSANWLYTPYSNTLSYGMPAWSDASPWATGELKKADELGLIPDMLRGANLKENITRAEFAAVAVKTYEALSGTKAIPIVNNPFTDCADVEVLKAYNLGAVNGTSATTFDPDALLNRQQAATMLTRVFKRVTLAGWTLATDSQFTLTYTKPALFTDDAKISDYAKDSVYFMVANGIINGTGSNMFSPQATTPAEQAQKYASATREQALIIAVRMVTNLK